MFEAPSGTTNDRRGSPTPSSGLSTTLAASGPDPARLSTRFPRAARTDPGGRSRARRSPARSCHGEEPLGGRPEADPAPPTMPGDRHDESSTPGHNETPEETSAP